MKPHYSMLIQWSEEDQLYIVTLPEFGGCHTHGKTYAEAATKGLEAIESLIDAYELDTKPLPQPAYFDHNSIDCASAVAA